MNDADLKSNFLRLYLWRGRRGGVKKGMVEAGLAIVL